MNFFKQIMAEFKNMLNSKFILISGIALFTIICVVVPIVVAMDNNRYDNYYYYSDNDYTIIVDGVEIPCSNDFCWELDSLQNNSKWMLENLETDESVKYAGDMMDTLIAFHSKYALATMGERDYTTNMCYSMSDLVKQNFVLQLTDVDEAALEQALNNVFYDPGYMELLNLTAEEKLDKISDNEEILAKYDDLMMNKNFASYVDLQKESYEKDIKDYKDQITMLEESLLDNPSQEEFVSEQISNLELSIKNIEEIYLPNLDYRLQNNIIPDGGSWQDHALNEKESALSSIEYIKKETLSEEKFKETDYLVNEYETYDKYLAYQEAALLEKESELFVAESSLNSGKPDMKFVSDGARARSHGLISVALFIGVFAVLVGGCAISTEFQNGTVRLLMIRPRTREKVLFSKFIAGLMLVYILYFAIYIVTIITNGFMFGFADYLYPNYTASGNVNYFVMYAQELMIISFALIFLYTLAFAISTTVRNTAVAIIVPTLAILGSFVLLEMMYEFDKMTWLAYTPFLYVSMADFFSDYSTLQRLADKGFNLSPALGMLNLTLYSLGFTGIATWVFKKTDITN